MERKEIACHYFLSRRNCCLSTGRDYACTKGIVKLINRSAPGIVRAPPKVSGRWSTIDRLRYYRSHSGHQNSLVSVHTCT